MTHTTKNLWVLLVLSLMLALVVACSGESGGTDGDSEDGDSPDGDTSDGDGPDGDDVNAVTSATPFVSGELDSSHEGWQRSDCLSCHAGIHKKAPYAPPECAACHGGNGAGFIPVSESHQPGGNCATCHARSHSGENFLSPVDCFSCHAFAKGAAECGSTEHFDVVVIGAGGGGLSTAATLSRAGKSVAILEKNTRVGGSMQTFARGDYTFEASLHGFDGLDEPGGMNVQMFKTLGIWDKVTRLRSDPMYVATYPDFTLAIPADVEEYRALLKTHFPDQAEGIDALFTELGELDRILKAVMIAQSQGIELPEEVSTDDLMKLLGYMDKNLTEVLDVYMTDDRLRAVFTQLAGFAGTPPDEVAALFFIAMWNSYHRGGYYYFEGGSQAVSDAMAEVIVENGGKVLTNSLVTRLDVQENRVTRAVTTDGRCYSADFFVSNANAPDTLLNMVGKAHLPAEYAEKLENMTVGLSAFVIYLGVDHDYRELFNDAHGLMTNDHYDTASIFAAILDCDPEKTAMAISNYSVADPGFAPAGKNSIVVISQLDFSCFADWGFDGEAADYVAANKEEVARYYIEKAEAYLPGLSQHIEVMEVATPRTIQGYTANPRGTIFGWDNTIEQSMQQRLEQKTPLDNLYLAGAWTFPGGGQSAVMISGLLAADMILKANPPAGGDPEGGK